MRSICFIFGICTTLALQGCSILTALPPEKLLDGVRTNFGGQLLLESVGLSQEDGHIVAALRWRTLSKPKMDYRVFMHVLDSQTGAILCQFDHNLYDSRLPSSTWYPGEFVRDAVVLAPLPDQVHGTYTIRMGVDGGPNLGLPIVESSADRPADGWRETAILIRGVELR